MLEATLRSYSMIYIVVKNTYKMGNTLNCFEKKVYFTYEGEPFVVDLTDSWNTINVNGKYMDINFYWEEATEEPSLCLYNVHLKKNGFYVVDTTINYPIKIDVIIGTFEDYMNNSKTYTITETQLDALIDKIIIKIEGTLSREGKSTKGLPICNSVRDTITTYFGKNCTNKI